ncbi:uncharacterized protein [Asterias amurensis]|uniref:uncharacterized protein n=1 Tax=Asterias amurensis TaxID=7602 RepID=UPI003AB40C45
MFVVNLVPLLLLVGVLTQSSVDADEHLGEQAIQLKDAIKAVVETVCKYSMEHNTDGVMTMIDPDARALVDGYPAFVGFDEIRTIVEVFPEKAAHIDVDIKEAKPMDKDANLVWSLFHVKFFNEAGEKYNDATQVTIFRKSPDGYKYYIADFNKRNQAA